MKLGGRFPVKDRDGVHAHIITEYVGFIESNNDIIHMIKENE